MSKTVKRMSKRVKRVMTVMMVGLVAILGTKAEAHYMYVSGKYYYHSVGCEVTIGSVPVHPDPVEVKCQLITITQDPITGQILPPVEVLCQNQNIITLPNPVSLVAQVLTDPGETHVEVIVSSSPFLQHLCDGSDPTAVLIHNFASTITISKCVGLFANPCSVLLPTSTATTLRCMLPTEENYDIYNLPDDGTPYTCSVPVSAHFN